MATIKLRKGQNPLSFFGNTAVAFSSLSWINPTNIVSIYPVSDNGASFTKFIPGSGFGPQSFFPTTDGTIAGYIIVTKVAVTVDAALFTPAPSLTKLATPTGLQATGTSASAISVIANSVANASSYRLYKSASSGGTYTQVGGTLATPSFSDTGLSAGLQQFYQWQAVGNGTAYSDSDLSAVFNGNTQAAGPYTLTPQFSDFSQTAGINELQSDGRYRHACFAVLEVNTNATTVAVRVNSTDARGGFSAYVDGTLIASYKVGIGTVTTNVSLPGGTATKRLKLVESSADQDQVGTPIIGATILDLTFPGGTTSSFYTSTFPEMLIGYGDSIMSGAICIDREREGWFPLQRSATRGAIAISHGSRTAKLAVGDPTAMAASLAALDAGFAGVTTKKIWWGLMVNDWIKQSWTPTQYAAAVGSFFDQAHAAHPTATIYVQTAILTFYNGGESSTINGYTLQDFRDAAAALVPSRSSYCVLADGKQLATSQEIDNNGGLGGDGLHPAKVGHANWAQRAIPILASGATPTVPESTDTWYSASPPNEFVTLDSATNVLSKTTSTNQWDGFGLGRKRVKAPAAGTASTVELARLTLPYPDLNNGTIVVGYSPSRVPSAAGTDRREAIVAGIYCDIVDRRLFLNGSPVTTSEISSPADGNLYVVAYPERIEIQADGAVLGSAPNTAFPLYLHGVSYFATPDGRTARISGAVQSGTNLETF